MSTFNLGNTVASSLGALCLHVFGVGRGAFDNLPALLLLRTATMFLPLLFIDPLLGGAAIRGDGKAKDA